MFKWKLKAPITASNAIYLEDNNGNEGRPFKARFLQAGLVKYNFGVCLLQKETIDKFINTFVGTPVVIDHKDFIMPDDVVGKIQNIWFSPEDGWFWCDGIIKDEKAIELIENGYNISCQYAITEYIDNTERKLHNGNPYDKEILNGVFEHLAIVKNPRYEGAFIAANAYIACNKEDDDDIEWITVKGNHIPIREGQTKEEAIQEFIEDRSTGGYSDRNKSNRSIAAELQGKDNATNLAKRLGIKSSEVQTLYSDEWHHTNKNYTKTKYYYTDAYLDLKKNGKISRETINKYNLNKYQIHGITQSWEKLNNRSKATPSEILKPYIEKYKDDEKLSKFLQEAASFKRTSQWQNKYSGAGGIRRFVEEFKNGEVSEEHLARIIKSYSKEEIEKSKASNSDDFNPMDYINKLDKGGQMDEKLKELCAGLVNAVMKAKNEADEEKEKTDEEKEKEEEEKEEAENKAKNEDEANKDKEKTASNEDTDKRKLIDEIGGILKGKVDEELWRTVIEKTEKLAYDRSSAGTADNKAKNKCKNENEDKEDEYEDLKEKIYEEVKNQIAKNSMDSLKSAFYEGKPSKPDPLYISLKKGLELGKQIYG